MDLALPKGNYFYFNTNNNCGEAIPQGKESYSPKTELSTPKIRYCQTTPKTQSIFKQYLQKYRHIYTLYNFLTCKSKFFAIFSATETFLTKANSRYCLNAGLDQSPKS